MTELYTALLALFNATDVSAFTGNPAATAAESVTAAKALQKYAVGGLHLGDAPHGTALPHITMRPASNTTTGVMGVTYREGFIITIGIWAPRYGLDAASVQLGNVKKVFDNQCPAFSGGGGIILNVRKTSGVFVELPEPEGGYMLPLDYDIRFRVV